MTKSKVVLVLNCGSSSIKFAIVDPITTDNVCSGLVQSIGSKNANLVWKQDGSKSQKDLPDINYQEALDVILDLVHKDQNLFSRICAVGHRVVHGGEYFTKSSIINDKVLGSIQDCQSLAPLHNPANILGIQAAQKSFPSLPQVAVFDTAFHQTMPRFAYLYAIPYDLYSQYKIRRYGFHGTSHRFVAQEAARILNKPFTQCSFITAHLGNGCSICAIANGKSVDTSMGLTPLEGLVMGTRSGDVDPSLHAHLVDQLGYDIHKVNDILNKQSGVLGISGLDYDMRIVEAAIEKGDERCILAGEILCYRLAKYIGAYMIPVGKIDALIFTGGIGENSPYVRANTLKWLSILNFHLDVKLNEENGKSTNGLITKENSVKALVVRTNEELMIAQDAFNLTQEKQ
jgi:acetate kinase